MPTFAILMGDCIIVTDDLKYIYIANLLTLVYINTV